MSSFIFYSKDNKGKNNSDKDNIRIHVNITMKDKIKKREIRNTENERVFVEDELNFCDIVVVTVLNIELLDGKGGCLLSIFWQQQ